MALIRDGFNKADIQKTIENFSPVAKSGTVFKYSEFVMESAAREIAVSKEKQQSLKMDSEKSQRIAELSNGVSELGDGQKPTVTEAYKIEFTAELIGKEKGWTGPESDIKIAQALLIQGYERHQIHQAINSLSPETVGKAQMDIVKYSQGITEKALTPEIKQQIQSRAKGNSLER